MESDYKAVIGCKVTDLNRLPVPGAILQPCAGCGKDISLAPSSVAILEQFPACRVLCLGCAIPALTPDDVVEPLTPTQREEISAAGIDPDESYARMVTDLKNKGLM